LGGGLFEKVDKLKFKFYFIEIIGLKSQTAFKSDVFVFKFLKIGMFGFRQSEFKLINDKNKWVKMNEKVVQI